MAGPGDIIVRIGAVSDRSVDTVFASIKEKSDRAFASVRRDSKQTAKEHQQNSNQIEFTEKEQARFVIAETRRAAAARIAIERDRFRENSRLARQLLAEEAKAERLSTALAAKASRSKLTQRQKDQREEEKNERAHQATLSRMAVNAAREQNRLKRAAAREAAREAYRSEREIDRFATRTSHRATRFFFPRPEGALGYSKRIAGDLMRGAGVDFSLAGGVARARERETAGMGLAQQERIATGKTRGGAAWAEVSRGVGEKLNVDSEQVTELMRAFTGKTGDFDAAAAKAGELASMTLAAGANMGEMGSAAGFVYNQLKGMPDAAERTLDVMRGIVGQTAVGAVEMEEYAKQMGRIAANAKMFQGDVSKNILELSALTQLSIAEGGATSGADAARSIAAFANTTSKGQRINAFKKQGIELFNAGGTQKRPILEIIQESLVKSKGNIPEMTKMWADTLGQKPIRGLTNAFNEAEAENAKKKTGRRAFGEAGWEAALAKIKPFMDTQMSKEQEKSNVEDYQKTMAAKAQSFQSKLDRITESLASNLLPALEKLAPQVLNLADSFAKAIQWAAGNPWQAVMVLLGASVARAATESLGRAMIDRLATAVAPSLGLGGGAVGGLAGLGGGGAGAAGAAGGAALGGVGGVAAGVGVVGAMALAGVVSFTIANAVIESVNTTLNNQEKQTVTSANDVFQQFAKEYANAKTPEEQASAWKRAQFSMSEVEGRRGLTERLFGEDPTQKTLEAMKTFAARSDKNKEQSQEASALQAANGQSMPVSDIALVVARELTGVLSKGLNVRVTNPDDMKSDVPGQTMTMASPLSYPQN